MHIRVLPLVLLFVGMVSFGCGGSGGSGFHLSLLSGEYIVETEIASRTGQCSFVSVGDPASFVDGIVTLSLLQNEVTVESSAPMHPLSGPVGGDGFQASASRPLGGMGAAALDVVWTFDGSGFSVIYEYSESFVGGAGCSVTLVGSAWRPS